MNLQERYELINFIAQSERTGLYMEPHEYNLLLQKNSILKFKKEIGLPEDYFNGQPTTKTAWEVSQRVTDMLRRFKVSATTAVSPAGLMTIPANYFYVTGVNDTYESNIKPVEILTDAEWGLRLRNSITTPSRNYPVARFMASTVEFNPVAISSVDWTYLRLPTTPVYAKKEENGILVFDSASSTELDWGEIAQEDITYMILEDLGIVIDPASINRYAREKATTGV